MSSIAMQSASHKSPSKTSGTNSLRNALELLRLVGNSKSPISISATAAAMGVSRSAASRLIHTLLSEGFLEHSATTETLSLGPSVLPLAAAYLDANRLRVEAIPHLSALANRIGERVNLGILYRGQVLYLAGVEKPTMPMIYSRFGKTVAANSCSIGKVILAHLPAEAEPNSIDPRLESAAYTSTPVPDARSDMEATVKRGYAIDREEQQRGTFCVAAAIFDSKRYPVAGVSASSHDLNSILKHVDEIRHTAELISHYL